ncbi:MAG: response regulator [Blastocatellia bacterium]|nr:response regulator [Blastocatellia bacterium]
MAITLLIAEDNSIIRKIFKEALETDGYRVLDAGTGTEALELIKQEAVDVLLTDVKMPEMDGIELLERAREVNPDLRAIVITGDNTSNTIISAFRNHACDLLLKPFSVNELRETVGAALQRPLRCELEIVSAKPDWIEIQAPCDLKAVEPIERFLADLQGNLPQETREAISSVFREMLNNAIEHGGKCDPTQKVEVKYIRLKRAIIYSIRDPGEGFDLSKIEHAAVANPEDDPFHHLEIRRKKGIRPGGFGILMAAQSIDELIYNEKHNEIMFVKYIDDDQDS